MDCLLKPLDRFSAPRPVTLTSMEDGARVTFPGSDLEGEVQNTSGACLCCGGTVAITVGRCIIGYVTLGEM